VKGSDATPRVLIPEGKRRGLFTSIHLPAPGPRYKQSGSAEFVTTGAPTYRGSKRGFRDRQQSVYMRDDDNRMPFDLIGSPATMFRSGGLKAIRITLFRVLFLLGDPSGNEVRESNFRNNRQSGSAHAGDKVVAVL